MKILYILLVYVIWWTISIQNFSDLHSYDIARSKPFSEKGQDCFCICLIQWSNTNPSCLCQGCLRCKIPFVTVQMKEQRSAHIQAHCNIITKHDTWILWPPENTSENIIRSLCVHYSSLASVDITLLPGVYFHYALGQCAWHIICLSQHQRLHEEQRGRVIYILLQQEMY